MRIAYMIAFFPFFFSLARFILFTYLRMPPKLTAAEIEANDAARLNELGYKQVFCIQHSESSKSLIHIR